MSHEHKVITLMTIHTSEQRFKFLSRGLERGRNDYQYSRAALLEAWNHLQIQRLCAGTKHARGGHRSSRQNTHT